MLQDKLANSNLSVNQTTISRYSATTNWDNLLSSNVNSFGTQIAPGGFTPAPAPTSFIAVLEIPSDNYTVTLPYTSSGTYTGTVDWGDGNVLTNANRVSNTYATAGTYTLTIDGTVNGFNVYMYDFYKNPERMQDGPRNFGPVLKSISQFGNQFSFGEDVGGYFGTCRILESIADDIPLAGYTNWDWALASCIVLNQDLSNWSAWTSNVTTMRFTFSSNENFNQPLNSWDVSNVTSMRSMFYGCLVFNQPLDSWNTSNVVGDGFFDMFDTCYAFNQDISSWDVSNATALSVMFRRCYAFNQPLDSWDVSNIEQFGGMFNSCSAFNQPLNSWDVSNATTFSTMFGSSGFNQPLDSWNLQSVVSVSQMFMGNQVFDQDISGWDVSNVNHMASMFRGATAFNQDISSWNVSNVVATIDGGFGNFLVGASSFSSTNLDAIYNGWSTQTLTHGLTFGASTCYDSSAQTGRNVLTGTYGWTVTDGGVC